MNIWISILWPVDLFPARRRRLSTLDAHSREREREQRERIYFLYPTMQENYYIIYTFLLWYVDTYRASEGLRCAPQATRQSFGHRLSLHKGLIIIIFGI